MDQDFKPRTKNESPLYDSVSWILGGIAVGLLIGLIYFTTSNSSEATTDSQLKQTESPQQMNAVAKLTPSENSENETASTSSKSDKNDKPTSLNQVIDEKFSSNQDDRPSFVYNAILPTLEVEVPVAKPTESSRSEEKRNEKPKKIPAKESVTKPGKYIVQVGASKSASQAEKAKKQVRALGLNPYVSKADVKGTTWYRVRIGPVTDLTQLKAIRSKLSGKGIDHFVRSVK